VRRAGRAGKRDALPPRRLATETQAAQINPYPPRAIAQTASPVDPGQAAVSTPFHAAPRHTWAPTAARPRAVIPDTRARDGVDQAVRGAGPAIAGGARTHTQPTLSADGVRPALPSPMQGGATQPAPRAREREHQREQPDPRPSPASCRPPSRASSRSSATSFDQHSLPGLWTARRSRTRTGRGRSRPAGPSCHLPLRRAVAGPLRARPRRARRAPGETPLDSKKPGRPTRFYATAVPPIAAAVRAPAGRLGRARAPCPARLRSLASRRPRSLCRPKPPSPPSLSEERTSLSSVTLWRYLPPGLIAVPRRPGGPVQDGL